MRTFFFFLCLLLLLPVNHLSAQKNITRRQVERVSDEHEALSPRKGFRATLGGGYAYRLGTMEKSGSKELDDFTSGLRNGFNIDTELQYFFQENFGVGLNANYISQSKTASGVLDIPGIGETPNYKESNRYIYVGPSFAMRFENTEWGFHMSAGYGAIFFTNEGRAGSLKASIDKTTFGSYIGVAGERRLSRNMGIGLKVSAVAGTVKIEGFRERMSVSNLFVTAFVSFRSN
ncbi:MAG TPA: hypothetical protein DIT04_14095 [Dysgonomonas sp.]|nr:hypothetical protein [Dysgonomonas sp.]